MVLLANAQNRSNGQKAKAPPQYLKSGIAPVCLTTGSTVAGNGEECGTVLQYWPPIGSLPPRDQNHLARSWNFTLEAARDLDSKLCLLAWLRVLSHELQACVWHSGRDAQFS